PPDFSGWGAVGAPQPCSSAPRAPRRRPQEAGRVYGSPLPMAGLRSYGGALLGLSPGLPVLAGAHREGKTNRVEALGYVATLSSHRVSSDTPLVRQGAPRAIIRTKIVRDERSMVVDLELNPGKANRARINRSPAGRPREVLGALRTVL